MQRRDFVTGLLCSAALPLALAACRASAQTAPEPVDVVEAFGFSPDGRTDNYDAFHRWAAHVNRAGGGNYLFPPGTYAVTRHRTRSLALRDPRTVINSLIDRVDGLTISGYGARIVLNGAFHRSGRPGPSGEAAGLHYAIFMPFEIHRSRNLVIKGFEMDGGVRNMSRDPEVGEIYAALIALNGCSNVLLEDLDLHHCQTDGIYLTSSFLGGKPSIACRNVTLRRVRSHNNARGGLGVFQVYGLLCEDCAFNRNGETRVKYLPHAPQYGVDVEPDYVKPNVDIHTGNVEFRRCEFMDNKSALLASYSANYIGYLRVLDCRSSNAPGGDYHMIISWAGAVIQGGVHDMGAGQICPSWQGQTGGDVTIRDCELRTSGLYGVLHYWDGNLARLENVKIVGTHSRPGTHGEVLLFHADPGGGRRNLVRNCDVFIPAARKAPAHAYDHEIVLKHTLSEGNMFRTDLPASGGQHFAVNYDVGARARGDRFRGTAPGPQDSFRPAYNSRHDTRSPFSSA